MFVLLSKIGYYGFSVGHNAISQRIPEVAIEACKIYAFFQQILGSSSFLQLHLAKLDPKQFQNRCCVLTKIKVCLQNGMVKSLCQKVPSETSTFLQLCDMGPINSLICIYKRDRLQINMARNGGSCDSTLRSRQDINKN